MGRINQEDEDIVVYSKDDPTAEAPAPTWATDGTGWLVTCPACNKTRVVGRQAIMSGRWLRCPFCAEGMALDAG